MASNTDLDWLHGNQKCFLCLRMLLFCCCCALGLQWVGLIAFTSVATPWEKCFSMTHATSSLTEMGRVIKGSQLRMASPTTDRLIQQPPPDDDLHTVACFHFCVCCYHFHFAFVISHSFLPWVLNFLSWLIGYFLASGGGAVAHQENSHPSR